MYKETNTHTHTQLVFKVCVSHPVIQYIWVWRSLHLDDGVEDVVYVVAEMQDGVGNDGFGGCDAGRQQGQSGGERQGRLKLLHCHFL